MRPIKFRAWDKKLKRYWWNVQNAYDTLYNHDTPDPDDDKEEEFEPSSFGDVFNHFLGDYVVEQFTGLLDKNGKEIYEGDIVRWRDGEHSLTLVEFIDGGFSPFSKANGECGLPIEWCEVIGNIHQNPELVRK